VVQPRLGAISCSSFCCSGFKRALEGKLSPEAQVQAMFISEKPQAEALLAGHYSSPYSASAAFSFLLLSLVEEVTCTSSRQYLRQAQSNWWQPPWSLRKQSGFPSAR
jgi:hypothetical protein